MEELTRLIREDMKPALGVTEPGAIAFAVASAKKYTKGEIVRVKVALNSGMYKNAFTCGIPNSARFGNLYAAALGAVAADEEKGLESLDAVRPEDDEEAARMVEAGRVDVVMDHVGSEITIDATVTTAEDTCTVRIRGSHTNIVEIEKNGQVIWRREEKSEEKDSADRQTEDGEALQGPVIHRYTLKQILHYIETVPVDEIEFIREAFPMNLELLQEGLDSGRAVIAAKLLEENGGELISGDPLKTAQLLCSGAIEARVLGLSRPAMSITGSGAHGIIATALSYLITMYIKEYSGKLSAFCGCGIAAGTGMACGLAWMRGADEVAISRVIWNMASGLTGMICDGGNHGCAMKGIVAVDAAFRSVDLSLAGISIEAIHGINGKTPEDTQGSASKRSTGSTARRRKTR